MTDLRWTWNVLDWQPVGTRRVGRPNLRWPDALDDLFKTHFDEDPGAWISSYEDGQAIEDDFCSQQ